MKEYTLLQLLNQTNLMLIVAAFNLAHNNSRVTFLDPEQDNSAANFAAGGSTTPKK